MEAFPDLPIELISFIVDYLGDDTEALRACALASRVFVARSQAQLFRRIRLWNRRTAPIIRSLITDKTTVGGDVSAIQKNISPDPHGVLSYTRTLSVSLGTSARGRQGIEDIYDHWIAFKNVRKLQASISTTPFIRRSCALLTHYFAQFRSTLRCLDLSTPLQTPKDVITFIAFFPFLEEVSIEMGFSFLSLLLPKESEDFNPDLLSPLKGRLQLNQFESENDFLTELARAPVQYHTLWINDVTVWTGFQEIVNACCSTLRMLSITY